MSALAGLHDGDEGQSLAEYALILALIAVVAIVALVYLGGAMSGTLSHIGSTIDAVNPLP